jgi:hypothetical protein
VPAAAQATTTVDTVAPTSTVASLPATSALSFTVSWSGQDNSGGSGVSTFDIFVSDNGGPFTALKTGTSQTTATFQGSAGHTYGFYSVATDNVGNREATPSAAEATTTALGTLTANPDTYVLGPGTTLSGSGTTSVLANDTAPDGMPQNLTAKLIAGVSHGNLSLNADGSFSYTPNGTFQGIDRFTYQVSEGAAAGNTTTVTLLSYNASLVDKLYDQVLHRPAEDQGLVFWTSQLNAGQKLDIVAKGIFNSSERLNPLVTQFYQRFLLRGTDPGGLAYWVADWQAKGDPDDVVVNILSSKEFYDDAGDTHDGFVKLLYERFLGRAFDPSGLAYWDGLLNSNQMTVQQVASTFRKTHEQHVDLVDFLFGEYFGNSSPTTTQAQPYVSLLDSGETQTQVEQAIIDSQAYSNSPPEPAPGTVGRALYQH